MHLASRQRDLSARQAGTAIINGVRATPGLEPEGNNQARIEDFKLSGLWTLAGLFLIMVFFAITGHGFERAWELIRGFVLTADMEVIRAVGDNLTSLLPTTAALLVIEVPLTLAIGLLLQKMYGIARSHGVLKFFSGVRHHYAKMTLIVIAEELFARGLFLGVPLWLWGDRLPDYVIYLLFLAGNGIWALVHLGNFTDKSERRVLMVLPQFVGGIILTAVFLNFGLVGSIIVHLAFNNLVMSVYRKETFNHDEFAVIGWRLVVCVASLLGLSALGKQLTDLSYWFYGPDFAVPGWEWQHYLLAVMFVTSALTILGELLLLDVHPDTVEARGFNGVGYSMFILLLAYGIYFGLGALGWPNDIQVLLMALAFLLVHRSGSASGMVRIFWIGLPSMMCMLCAVLALGFNSAGWLIALAVPLLDIPDHRFRIWSAKKEGRIASPSHKEQ